MSEKLTNLEILTRMGNCYFLIVGHGELKLFAAMVDNEKINFLKMPLIQDVSELPNTLADLHALEYLTANFELGYGYTMTVYRAPDVPFSSVTLSLAFDSFIQDLLAGAS